MRKAFAETLTRLAAEDSRVAFITGDLGFQVFDEFERRFGGRYVNVGVAEAQMIYTAAGMAAEGWRPIAYSIASFATARPFEQIRFCVAYPNLPVVLVGAGRGYLYSSSGVSHHAGDDLALMTALPNMAVVAPGDPGEIRDLLPQVIARGGPAYFTVGRFGEPAYDAPEPAVLGRARLLRPGARLAVISTGELANEALAAHARLSEAGIEPAVYQMHTVKPLDRATLDALADDHWALIVVEEHVPSGGLWAAVADWNARRDRPCVVRRLGAPDRFALGNLSQRELRRRWGFDAEAIATACRDLWPSGRARVVVPGLPVPDGRSRFPRVEGTGPSRRRVDVHEFAELVGRRPADLTPGCVDRIRGADLRYAPLTDGERDRHLRATLDRLESLVARNPEAIREVFEQGWREQVRVCAAEGVSWETLKPRYVKPFSVVRYRDDLVAPASSVFVDELLSSLVTFACETYLGAADTVYEFGCGTGRYLYLLWQIFPSKTLVGLDWTDASLDLVDLMAKAGVPVRGVRFNLLKPDPTVRLAPGSAVTTVSALEQLGDRAGSFLDYLLDAGPSVVVHLEPIAEFYDPGDLLDSLALAYHRRRGYLTGFWPALEARERQGCVEILEARRTHFGDPFHDGMSLVAWRPRR